MKLKSQLIGKKFKHGVVNPRGVPKIGLISKTGIEPTSLNSLQGCVCIM